MKKITVLLLAFVMFTASSPLKDFEGTIIYGIQYLELPEDAKGMEAMLPSELSYSIKGSKVKVQQEVMGGSQTILSDQDAKTGDVLMDMMGQKIHIHMSKEDIEAEEAKTSGNTDIEYFDETKTISGFKCKKAIIKSAESSVTLWYTNEIEAKNVDFNKLNGFPLEYITEANGMKVKMTAKNIERKKLADGHFAIPSGYKTMTLEEIGSLFGNH